MREPLGVQRQWWLGWIEFHSDTGVYGEYGICPQPPRTRGRHVAKFAE